MNRAARLSLVALGLVAAVYGTASLTGGWLGTPPWWEHTERDVASEFRERWFGKRKGPGDPEPYGLRMDRRPIAEIYGSVPNTGRELISVGVVAAGVVLVVVGAWSRRRNDGVEFRQ